MNTYVKLYGSIIHSSIWSQPDHVRLVWITMLAMADMEGDVHASPLGIANASRQSIEKTMEALHALSNPEPYSRDGTDGKRIVPIERGYRILNHSYYRNLRTPKQIAEAERKASYRMSSGQSGTVPDVPGTSADTVSVDESVLMSVKEREPERVESAKKPKKPKSDAVERPAEVSQEHWDGWLAARRKKRAIDPTNLVMKAMRRESEKAGISLDDAVRIAAEKGWQAFDASWYSGSSGSRPGAKQSIFNAPLMQPDPEDTSNVWTEEDERQDQENLRRLVSKMTPEKRAKWEAEQIAQGCEVYRGDWPPERLAAWEAERLASGQKIWRDGR